MGRNIRNLVGFAAAATLLASAVAPALATQLITNGNFETGAFAPWTVFVQPGSAGNAFIDTPGTTTPVSGKTTAPNPVGGNFYAVTDQSGPGAYAIIQPITIAPGSTVIVSFDLFINNYGTNGLVNGGLDYTNANGTENGRVDILTAASAPFSTAAGDIVDTLIPPSGSGVGNPQPYTHYSFNVSAPLAGGGTFQLRFAEADNQGFFNLGFDNVSVTSVIVPEPASLTLLGFAAAAFLARRRKA